MKKTLFSFSLLFVLCFAHAQNLSNHVPLLSHYIITIAPEVHAANGDIKTINKLEMFTRTDEYGSGYNYLYGDQFLDEKTQLAFRQLFSDMFANTAPTGISMQDRMFIFSNYSDSIEYWAYILPLQNSQQFEDYTTTHLFSEKPTVDNGSGFKSVTADKISIGWTNSYAVILLASYRYYDMLNSFAELKENLVQDSINAVEAVQAEMREAAAFDNGITDSLRQAKTQSLLAEMNAMRDSLAKDTTPEEKVWVYYAYDHNNDVYATVDNEQEEERERRRTARIDNFALLALKRILNLNENESVQTNKNFRDIQSEKFDAAYWYNYGAIVQQSYYQYRANFNRYNYYNDQSLPDTTDIATLWENAYTAGIFRFDGNTARMEQRSYFSPQLREMTQGIYHGRIHRRMLNYVKGENLMGFYAMSADMEKLMKFGGNLYREYITQMMYFSNETPMLLAVMDLARVFIDEKTLYNLLDGDILVAVTDLRPFLSSYVTYDYDENFNRVEVRKERLEVRPEFVMTVGIGEMKKAKEIIGILERGGMIKKQNELYYSINMPGNYDMKIYLALRKKVLVISNNEDLMQNHIKRGYPRKLRMARAQRRIARKSPIVAWWNGTKTFELIKKNQSNDISEAEKQSIDILQKSVKSGTMLGVRPRNGVQIIETTIEMNDNAEANETSMLRFFKLLNSLYLINSAYTRGY